MTLTQLLALREERQTAMQRARYCKANGFPGVASDVRLARHLHRSLLRALNTRRAA